MYILINIPLKFVSKAQIKNIPAGDKPFLNQSMLVWLLTHVCVTRPQWVKVIIYIPSFTWPHLGIITAFITKKNLLDYMPNRTLKTNVEPRWPLKSNLELRWPPFVCHVIWDVFATRNARTFVRSEDSEPFVRRTSRIKKPAYERILAFATAQWNTPNAKSPRRQPYYSDIDFLLFVLETFLRLVCSEV